MKSSQLKYRNHPAIEGLSIREDGMDVQFKGETIKVLPYKLKNTKQIQYRVNLLGQSLSLQKLVCECWHGMRPNRSYCSHRVHDYANIHYSNLYWGKCGANHLQSDVARSSLSKINKEDIKNIVKRINAGDTLKEIAGDYNTSGMSIHRIKKRYIDDKTK